MSYRKRLFPAGKPILAILSYLLAFSLLTAVAASEPPPGVRDSRALPRESMTAAATRVLHLVVEARGALRAGEAGRARRLLQQAMTGIEYIEGIRPSTRVTHHIWAAERHLDFREPHAVAPDLIPIELSLADLEEVVASGRARTHLQDTRDHLERGDTEGARRQLKRLRESLPQTEIELPLTSTSQHIGRALALLSEGRVGKAEDALQAAEAGVRFVSLGDSAPLVQARRSLWRSMESLAAGHEQAMRADLARALEWLDSLAGGTDPKIDAEAVRLRTDIQELLDRKLSGARQAETELGGFWHRVAGLIEREAEKLYHAWRDQQSENHLYRQLIDAKLHLYYAEHELFESRDGDEAARELEQTIGFLQAAVAAAEEPCRSRIRELEDEIRALAPLAARPDDEARARYEQALADLRRMVKAM